MKCTYASSESLWERKPQKKPTSLPRSSATRRSRGNGRRRGAAVSAASASPPPRRRPRQPHSHDLRIPPGESWSCRLAEHRCGPRRDPPCGNVAEVLWERPFVAEGIDDLAMAVAPEHVLKRLGDLCARIQRALPESIDVVGKNAERAVDTADRERRNDSQLGELVGDHHGRVTEAKRDLHEPAVGNGYTTAFLSVESSDVPVGRGGGVATHEVNGDRVPHVGALGLLGHDCLLGLSGGSGP